VVKEIIHNIYHEIICRMKI